MWLSSTNSPPHNQNAEAAKLRRTSCQESLVAIRIFFWQLAYLCKLCGIRNICPAKQKRGKGSIKGELGVSELNPPGDAWNTSKSEKPARAVYAGVTGEERPPKKLRVGKEISSRMRRQIYDSCQICKGSVYSHSASPCDSRGKPCTIYPCMKSNTKSRQSVPAILEGWENANMILPFRTKRIVQCMHNEKPYLGHESGAGRALGIGKPYANAKTTNMKSPERSMSYVPSLPSSPSRNK